MSSMRLPNLPKIRDPNFYSVTIPTWVVVLILLILVCLVGLVVSLSRSDTNRHPQKNDIADVRKSSTISASFSGAP